MTYKEVWPDEAKGLATIMANVVFTHVPVGGICNIVGDYLNAGTIEDLKNACPRPVIITDLEEYVKRVVLEDVDALYSFRKAVAAVYRGEIVYTNPESKREQSGNRHTNDPSRSVVTLAINRDCWRVVKPDPPYKIPKFAPVKPPRCYLISRACRGLPNYQQVCKEMKITCFVYEIVKKA